jgi:hypothetical protein
MSFLARDIFPAYRWLRVAAVVRPFNLINLSETAGATHSTWFKTFKQFKSFKTLRRFNLPGSRFKELTTRQPFKRFKSFKPSNAFNRY